jgi:hypothetical protein
MLPRNSWKWTFPAFILVAILASFFNSPDPAVTAPDIEYVQRVVDGDTLVLGTGERVRLIGVDDHSSGSSLKRIFAAWERIQPSRLQVFEQYFFGVRRHAFLPLDSGKSSIGP